VTNKLRDRNVGLRAAGAPERGHGNRWRPGFRRANRGRHL